MNEEETKALKEKIISTRKEIHKITQKEALARWSYEENVIFSFFFILFRIDALHLQLNIYFLIL